MAIYQQVASIQWKTKKQKKNLKMKCSVKVHTYYTSIHFNRAFIAIYRELERG